MDLIKLINKANYNLQKRFPSRFEPITPSDVESVYSRQLLSIESDAKTTKGSKNGYLTGVLYLAPSNISGINTCPAASKGCSSACLFEAGRGVMWPVFKARVIKTIAYYADKKRFEAAINESIRKLKVKAHNKGMTPIVRLNGTSDIMWDKVSTIIQDNSDVQFYDYTKITARFNMKLPNNYDLTYSLHETNKDAIMRIVQGGGRVAVVFRHELPDSYWNVGVVNGDDTDLRFLDPTNCIVGLKAKGPAKNDQSGFVLDKYTDIKAA
jgi:hypothetical protein